MMRAWAGYAFHGKLPFPLTKGERVFLAALQIIDIYLAYWVTR